MRAVVYHGFGEPPGIEVVPDPTVSAHGAIIRVEATGLCRSDWHGWMGHDPDITAFPHVPGHELAGVVEAVGEEVRSWQPGARVTVPFVCACGSCAQCANGDHQICDRQTQPGFTHWGSFAELVAIEHAEVNLVALPDGLGFEPAASLGCRFATAYRAVIQVGRLAEGEWVAVHGCGGVGLSAVMIAAAAGARVVAVDPSGEARRLALEVGAEIALEDPAEVSDMHLSLDAFGSEASCAASIRSLRKRGRHVQVGLLPDPPRLPMHLVIAGELELLGTHGMAAHTYPDMLGLVVAGQLRPDRLITRRIGLDEAPGALVAMGETAGVTVITPRGPDGPSGPPART